MKDLKDQKKTKSLKPMKTLTNLKRTPLGEGATRKSLIHINKSNISEGGDNAN